MPPISPLTVLIIAILAIAVGIAIGFFISRNQTGNNQLEQHEKTEKKLSEAREQGRVIELQARDNALKISQAAESEITRLRSELTREEERLQHRRAELDTRVDRLEQREQALNKRQSTVDKRANEIEKLHQQQMDEIQRVAQMNTEEARVILLAEVEKDARGDMARIIRQI